MYTKSPEIEHACSIFLDTYTKSPEIEHACFNFLDAYIRCLEIEHACSNFLGTYIGSLEIKNASVKFYTRVFVRFLHVFVHFQSFFVRFSERNGIYFLAIVYNRVPLSSVVISSNSGSIAFTKASNHVWYASIMNLGSTPAVRQ